MTEKQTVAGAYAKIESHEEICAERYKNIHGTMGIMKDDFKDLKGLIYWILAGVAMVVVSLMAWMAVQLWTAGNARIAALEAHPAAVVGK